MKQIILSAVLLAILNVATVPARAATFYVNGATGNDNNSGSTSAPWKSISKAANTLIAGDTVIIRAGVYRETVTPLNSGTAANPITYKAEPGAEVIISGTDLLTSPWSQHSGNIYKANVQLPLGDGAQLFVNGNMMMEASWPNNPGTASDTTWLVERKLSTATEGTEIIPPPTIPTRYSIVGGEINVAVPVGSRVFISTMLGHGWSNYTCEVVGYDPGLKKITFDVPFVLEPNQNKVSYTGGANPRKSRFFLHGDLSYLDMEKEYFYDSDTGTLYLYQPGGGSPSANSVEYKVRNTGINLDGRKFINLEGIDLFACNLISNSASGNIIVDDLKANYPSHWSTSAVPTDIVGIKLFGSNNVIRNSDISYSMGHGIHVSGDNTKILNNEVTDCGYLGIYRNNIWVDGSHHVVSYNTALRSGRSILGGKFANTKISNNEFAYANYLSADGACMYLGFWDTGNSEISHNYVHHTGDPASTTGIYFDNYCHNAIIHHNYTEGMQINGPRSGMTIVNNTIVGRGLVWDYWVKHSSGQYIYADDGAGTYIANNIVSRNLMNLNRIPAIYDMMNWDENQRGVGTAKVLSNGDLSSDSPCIDVSGVETLPHIHSNVTDGKPDLGAFEYGVARWEYGHDFSTSREEQLEVFDFPLMNQMKNPGFELGVNGWTNVYQSISEGKRGKAARITGNSSIYQTVAGLKPNTTYTISAWSKDGTPVMEVSGYGGVNVSEAGDVLSTVWTLNELEITTGPSNTSAIVHLKNNGAGFVDWDQAGVYIHLQNRQVGDPPPSGRLLIWTNLVGGNATGSWAAQANWSGGTLTTTANDTADFSRLNLTAASTVSLNGNQAINKLLFADATTASHDWTVAAGTPSTSTLTLGGTTPEISVTNRTATISAKLTGFANWTKKGAGTLRLSNTTNSFTGDVTVSGGTLAVAGGNAIPDSGKLVILSGGKVDPSGTTETVGTLFFGGVQQIAGTWGSTTSTATNKNNTYFTGTGVVLVTSGPSVTVTFDAQSGTAPSPASKSVTVGSTYGTLATTSRSGYTFAGWWTGAGGTGSEVMAATVVSTASNHTLYAKWTANTYTVTFDAQSGTAPSPASKSVTVGSTYGTLATTSRSGYTFAGWWTGAGGTGSEVTAATVANTASNHTLYAKWTANSYTVTFDAQSGALPSPASKSVTIGSPYGTLATTTRSGYTFAGWWTGAGGTGSEVTAATVASTASNHTLYAKWTADNTPGTFTWTKLVSGNATGSWVDQANWSGGTLATTTNDTADFSTLNITAASTVSLNGSQEINKLLFADATTASHDWTVAAGTPSTSTLTLGGTTPEISVTNRTAIISGKLAGSVGWTKTGAGKLTLKNASNSFTGAITVQTGVLEDFQGSLGNAGGVTINSTANTTTGGQLILQSYGAQVDFNRPVVMQGAGGGTALTLTGNAAALCNMNGAITLDGTGNYKIQVYLAPSYYKINGGIARTGANTGTLSLDLNHWQQTTPVRLTINSTIDNNGGPVTLLGNSAGILQMDVAGHDLGDFTVNGAYNLTPTNYQTILKLGISDALSTGKNLTLTKGTFDLAGFNQTVNALGGVLNASLITNTGSSASTLTIGNGGGSGTFSGVISDGTAAISLVKTGSGIQTLAGPNSYSGDTTVAGGTLVQKQVNTSNESASVTIAASAVLGLDFAGTDTVGKLFLGTPAVQVPTGTYNASHPTYGAYFSFGGSLVVSSGFASNSAPLLEDLATWITGSFAGGFVPADQRGPNDDPDGDGISNLMEYAIAGLDPTVPNAAVGTFSGLTLSFNKRQPLATDISYVIETSPNLLPPWTARVTHTAPGNTDATISHTLPADQGEIFARLKITQP